MAEGGLDHPVAPEGAGMGSKSHPTSPDINDDGTKVQTLFSGVSRVKWNNKYPIIIKNRPNEQNDLCWLSKATHDE